jgi:predicted aconitase with swiveling domain
MLDGKQGDDGLSQTLPAGSALPAGIDRRSFVQRAVIAAAAVMTGADFTPEARAAQAAQQPNEKIVLTGIARSKGKAAGEALVNRQRMGWAFNHVGNEDGIVLVPGADIQGKSVIGKVVVYPTVMGSTTGAISLYYKCKISHHGPAAIICQTVHAIDISGAIAGEIPAVDNLNQDPITTIKTGDWVEIDAPKVGQKATVTITRKG